VKLYGVQIYTRQNYDSTKISTNTKEKDVIVRPLSIVGYTSVVASVIHSRQWSN